MEKEIEYLVSCQGDPRWILLEVAAGKEAFTTSKGEGQKVRQVLEDEWPEKRR